MTIQRQMSVKFPVHHSPPFRCCRPKPWRRRAALSNLRRNNEKRPRSDTKKKENVALKCFKLNR